MTLCRQAHCLLCCDRHYGRSRPPKHGRGPASAAGYLPGTTVPVTLPTAASLLPEIRHKAQSQSRAEAGTATDKPEGRPLELPPPHSHYLHLLWMDFLLLHGVQWPSAVLGGDGGCCGAGSGSSQLSRTLAQWFCKPHTTAWKHTAQSGLDWPRSLTSHTCQGALKHRKIQRETETQRVRRNRVKAASRKHQKNQHSQRSDEGSVIGKGEWKPHEKRKNQKLEQNSNSRKLKKF